MLIISSMAFLYSWNKLLKCLTLFSTDNVGVVVISYLHMVIYR